MLWKSGPFPMCQFMWYTPGMGKGAARPCIGTICFPSILTYSRVKWINPWPELRIPLLWLQCHLWVVHLLRQDCLGWSHQAQQAAHPRVVQIDLLHLDMAPEPPGTNFHGGIEIWSAGRYWTDQHLKCIGWPVYLSAYCALSVYHFLGKYSVKCTLLATSDVCQTLSTPAFRGTPSM